MEQKVLTIPKRTNEVSVSRTVVGDKILDRELTTTPLIREPALLYSISKRSLDLVLAFFGLLILVPVFLAIAIRIKLSDGGSILHFREVVGLQGRRFYALKFRTMIPDADAYLAKHPDLLRKYQKNMKLDKDPRITPFGDFLRKTSMDELPQLFNVLIGQMSLVGPRIIHPSELPRFGEYAEKRLAVRPGITGLWQISGRQHISYEERVLLDMQYIDNRSFIGDLAILFRTVFILHTGV